MSNDRWPGVDVKICFSIYRAQAFFFINCFIVSLFLVDVFCRLLLFLLWLFLFLFLFLFFLFLFLFFLLLLFVLPVD